MSIEIPKFEGREVHAARIALSGSFDTDMILRDDDEVVLLVRGKVAGIKHSTDSFGVRRRVQSVKAGGGIEADPATAEQAAEQIKRLEDELAGQTSLDDELDDEHDDENEGDDG